MNPLVHVQFHSLLKKGIEILTLLFACASVFCALMFTLIYIVYPTEVSAQSNPEINYQGKLLDNSGVAVTDGLYHMRFWLYDAASGGTALWVGDHSTVSSNRADVTSGLFSVMLGSSSPLTGVDFNQPLWLEVEIGGTASSGWETLTPRKRIGTVPSAFEAKQLDGLASSSLLRSDASDNFTSGTLTFDAGTTLQVDGAGIFASATSTNFYTSLFGMNSEYFSDLTGSGLINDSGSLRVATSALGMTLDLLDDVDPTGSVYGTMLSYTGSSWATTSTSTLGLGNGSFLGLSDTPGSYSVTNGLLYESGGALTFSSGFTFNGSLFTTPALLSVGSSTIGGGTGATGLTINGNATTTGYMVVQGAGTSTFSNGLEVGSLNVTGGATSTYANGINITAGCYAIGNTCIGGGVSTLAALTDTDTDGAVYGSILQYTGSQWSTTSTSSLAINTDDLVEGTNQFFTNARVASYINSSSSIAAISGSAYGDQFIWNGSNWITTATTSLGIAIGDTIGTLAVSRGGTGITDTPTYGDVLLGNAGGTYTLTGTTSLGLGNGSFLGLSDTPGSYSVTNGLLYESGGALTFSSSFTFNGSLLTTPNLLSVGSSTIGGGTGATGLTINGNATTTGYMVVQGAGTSTITNGLEAGSLYISGAATSTFANGLDITTGCYAVNGTCLSTGGATTFLGLTDTPDIYAQGSILFTSGSGVASDTQQFFFDDTNNRLGLGSTTPWGKLSVNYVDGTDTGPRFVVGSSTANNFVVSSDGFVGMGTSTPGSPLSIVSNIGDFTNVRVQNDSAFWGGGYAAYNNNNEYIYMGVRGTSFTPSGITNPSDALIYSIRPLKIIADGQDLWFTSESGTDPTVALEGGTGNVGIGTSSPTSRLSVWSDTADTGAAVFNVVDSASTSLLTVTDAGKVGVSTSSPWAKFAVVADGGQLNPIFEIASSSDQSFVRVTADGLMGLGTTTPRALLSMGDTSTAGDSNGIVGIDQLFTVDPSGGGTQYMNYLSVNNEPTSVANTLVGSLIRVTDDTSLANVVRALEVQAQFGGNSQGENTAISGFGRTFGVRAVTEGDAGGTYVPAGLYAESKGTTQGNAIRAYTSTLTAGELVYLYHEDTAFGSTSLRINMGNDTGGSFTGNFVDFQVAGVSKFTVSANGTTTIGDGTNPAGLNILNGGLCVDTDGCTATTSGRIAYRDSFVGNSDLAEMYFSNENLEKGDIVSATGGLSIGKARFAGESSPAVIGIVSTKPGIMLGADDKAEFQQSYPVGLVGRVPVKVSTENGDIEVGDQIVLSSLAGIGMKGESGQGPIVGIALEAFDEDQYYYSEETIKMYVDSEYHPRLDPSRVQRSTYDARLDGGGTLEEEAEKRESKKNDDKSTGRETVKAANVYSEPSKESSEVDQERLPDEMRLENGEEVVVGQVMVFINLGVYDRAAYGKTADLDEVGFFDRVMGAFESAGLTLVDGVLTVKELVASVVRADKVITKGIEMPDQATGDTYCVTIVNGEFVKTQGECGGVTTVPSGNGGDVEYDDSQSSSGNEMPDTDGTTASSTASTTPETTATTTPEGVENEIEETSAGPGNGQASSTPAAENSQSQNAKNSQKNSDSSESVTEISEDLGSDEGEEAEIIETEEEPEAEEEIEEPEPEPEVVEEPAPDDQV